MERVLDIYKKPYDAAFPIMCMDESPKQLIQEGQPSKAMRPGYEAKVDYEYIRHGVVNIFMANEPLKVGVLWRLQHLRPKRNGLCL